MKLTAEWCRSFAAQARVKMPQQSPCFGYKSLVADGVLHRILQLQIRNCDSRWSVVLVEQHCKCNSAAEHGCDSVVTSTCRTGL